MDDRRPQPFQFSPSFAAIEDTGSFQPGDFEAEYTKLFAEALDEGMSAEDRERLDLAAEALGLSSEKISHLEQTLRSAYEAKASITISEIGSPWLSDPGTLADRAPPSIAPPPPTTNPYAPASEPATSASPTSPGEVDDEDTGPVTYRTPSLPEISEAELEEAPDTPRDVAPALQAMRNTPAYGEEYDDEEAPPASVEEIEDNRPTPPSFLASTGPTELTEEEALHERFLRLGAQGQVDAQLCTASVLVRRHQATPAENELYRAYQKNQLQRPERPLTTAAWSSLLFHPHQDRTIGEIFSVIASAALFARVSAMRIDGTLVRLDPKKKQDPATSTVSVVRAIEWSAATLGLMAPPVYLAPELDNGLEIIPSIPPATRVGRQMLSGRSALELAFQCARHITWFREEYFICTLVPAVQHLEDIFVAALLIGVPDLPLENDAHERARLNRDAILPVLRSEDIQALRHLGQQFLERGMRLSLRRWAQAAEFTACRAGLLVSGDLATAAEVLLREANGAERLAEVESFWASDAAAELRRDLGVAVS
jgi:hypothetical protein